MRRSRQCEVIFGVLLDVMKKQIRNVVFSFKIDIREGTENNDRNLKIITLNFSTSFTFLKEARVRHASNYKKCFKLKI